MRRRLLIPEASACSASDPTIDSEGWVPVGYDWSGRGPRVIWASHPNVALPFFPRIALTRCGGADGFRQTDFSALVRIASQLPDISPAGLIFHISRCGSTLVSNVCRCDENAVVLSEPPFISGTFDDEVMQHLTARGQAEVMRAFVRLYTYRLSRRATGNRRVVIKFTGWESLIIREIRAIWPDAPALILVRHPAEVVLSNLKGPAVWIKERYCPKRLRRVLELPIDFDRFQISEVEFVALSLGGQCEALLSSLDDRCYIVDYEELDTPLINKILRVFGLAATKDAIEKVMATYSKDPSQRTQFADDRVKKRSAVTPDILDAVAKWSYEPYLRLRHRREAVATT